MKKNNGLITNLMHFSTLSISKCAQMTHSSVSLSRYTWHYQHIPLRQAIPQVHRSIKECYPDSTMLSFVQVQNRLKFISGILPLHFDMCTNSCMAFTGPFLELKKCLFYSEDCFQQSPQGDMSIPCCQFVTFPIGPQLQAFWCHPITVTKLRDHLQHTCKSLADRITQNGIQYYNDICCSLKYLDLVESGKIHNNDMLFNMSMDGAQLYRDKDSDAWFGILRLLDFLSKI